MVAQIISGAGSTWASRRLVKLTILSIAPILLASCGTDGDAQESSGLYGEVDASTIRQVPLAEVEVGQCLATPEVRDGQASVADCPTGNGARVVAVTTFGPDAPSSQPEPPVADGYASVACTPPLDVYSEERGLPEAGPIRMYVYSLDSWEGPNTTLVCAMTDEQ